MSSRAVPLVAAIETEVTEKAKRRTLTAEYKRRILQAADACSKLGELGALLRSEGLYPSHLAAWRRASRIGEMDGLTPIAPPKVYATLLDEGTQDAQTAATAAEVSQ